MSTNDFNTIPDFSTSGLRRANGDNGLICVEQRLQLPYPPSVNGLYTNVPGKGRVKSKGYRAWAKLAGTKIRLQHSQKFTGSVAVSVIAVRPDKRKRDIDNLIKPTLDLLVDMGVIEDDSLVNQLYMEWVSDDFAPGIYVTIAKRQVT